MPTGAAAGSAAERFGCPNIVVTGGTIAREPGFGNDHYRKRPGQPSSVQLWCQAPELHTAFACVLATIKGPGTDMEFIVKAPASARMRTGGKRPSGRREEPDRRGSRGPACAGPLPSNRQGPLGLSSEGLDPEGVDRHDGLWHALNVAPGPPFSDTHPICDG
jgi:hypothetical protein